MQIYSLEYMVRQITDRLSIETWKGLDKKVDYPHIIGNSTTKHVEYLIRRYQDDIHPDSLWRHYLKAAMGTIRNGRDPQRTREVRSNLKNLGCSDLLSEMDTKRPNTMIPENMISRHINTIKLNSFSDRVRAGIDIYYHRYHSILEAIRAGRGEELTRELLPSGSTRLIEPMPGIGIYIALIKGWLSDDIGLLFPLLYQSIEQNTPDIASSISVEKARVNLQELAERFRRSPQKIAVVTSSIAYEAEIVLAEVFRVLCEQIQGWPISSSRRQFLMEKFSDYHNIYDGFVTASDSSEIRLKPHRDLYSIALHQLGLVKKDFGKVIGLEDSKSGTVAIRAAGIGLCIAVPFADTQGHDFQAATRVLKGGLPELLLRHNLFLPTQSS